MNNDYTFDVTKYKQKGEQRHFTKFHIFTNFDFTNKTMCFEPAVSAAEYNINTAHIDYENHRVHIFFSKSNPSIANGSLKEFIDKCKTACRRNVMIHIPKRNPELKKEIEKALGDPFYGNWNIIFEKNTNITFFYHGSTYPILSKNTRWRDKAYMYVTWVPDDEIQIGFIDESDKDKPIAVIKEN